MVFINGYFDESYESPNPRTYTVAGYISTDDQWSEFQKEWREALIREVLPDWLRVWGDRTYTDRPLHFHMTDFDNGYSKIYGGWPKERKKEFLKELHGIIQRHYVRSFSTGIVMADWDRLSEAEQYVLGSPHICAAINCIKQVAMWANKNVHYELILYVFERGSDYDSEMNRLFNLTASDVERSYYRIDKLAFDTKAGMSPLQAADMLAFETRKEISRFLDTQNPRKARESIMNLNVPLLDDWVYMNEGELRKILNAPLVRTILETANYKEHVAATGRKWLM